MAKSLNAISARAALWDYRREELINAQLATWFNDLGIEPAYDWLSLAKLVRTLAEHEAWHTDQRRRPGNPGKDRDLELVCAFLRSRVTWKGVAKWTAAAAALQVANKLGKATDPDALGALVKRYKRQMKMVRPSELEAIREWVADNETSIFQPDNETSILPE